jgi:hypothetical protein
MATQGVAVSLQPFLIVPAADICGLSKISEILRAAATRRTHLIEKLTRGYRPETIWIQPSIKPSFMERMDV